MSNLTTATSSTTWRLARVILAGLAALHLAGCDYFPRDPEATLDQVRANATLRVGIERPIPSEAERLVRQIERATGAKAFIDRGGVEPLLAKLEAGEIDLVIALFGKDSPWAAKAALSPPLRVEGEGKDRIEWRAAMRSGENRWIMLVETRARRVSSAREAS